MANHPSLRPILRGLYTDEPQASPPVRVPQRENRDHMTILAPGVAGGLL